MFYYEKKYKIQQYFPYFSCQNMLYYEEYYKIQVYNEKYTALAAETGCSIRFLFVFDSYSIRIRFD